MTNTEAKESLEVIARHTEWEYPIEWQVAIEMAIKALKQCTCERCAWSAQPWIEGKEYMNYCIKKECAGQDLAGCDEWEEDE